MDEKPKRKEADQQPNDKENKLDESLEDTFPASDPATTTRQSEDDAKPKGR